VATGPAGVTAAIAAARAGSEGAPLRSPRLPRRRLDVLVGYLLDFDKPGFEPGAGPGVRERDAIVGTGVNGIGYHPEEMKLVLEELCVAAGVKVHLHTRIVAVHEVGRRVNAIVAESKSGREAWHAAAFVERDRRR
jgi:hypothetical protein